MEHLRHGPLASHRLPPRGASDREVARVVFLNRGLVLLQLAGHTIHRGAQLGADRGERQDGGDRDQRSDETVLDGRGTLFVGHELAEHGQHLTYLQRSGSPRKSFKKSISYQKMRKSDVKTPWQSPIAGAGGVRNLIALK